MNETFVRAILRRSTHELPLRATFVKNDVGARSLTHLVSICRTSRTVQLEAESLPWAERIAATFTRNNSVQGLNEWESDGYRTYRFTICSGELIDKMVKLVVPGLQRIEHCLPVNTLELLLEKRGRKRRENLVNELRTQCLPKDFVAEIEDFGMNVAFADEDEFPGLPLLVFQLIDVDDVIAKVILDGWSGYAFFYPKQKQPEPYKKPRQVIRHLHERFNEWLERTTLPPPKA